MVLRVMQDTTTLMLNMDMPNKDLRVKWMKKLFTHLYKKPKASHWLGNSTWHCLISFLNLILMTSIMNAHQTFFMHNNKYPWLVSENTGHPLPNRTVNILDNFSERRNSLILTRLQENEQEAPCSPHFNEETVAWMDFLHSLQWVKQNMTNEWV
jgi:hypothetical protein